MSEYHELSGQRLELRQKRVRLEDALASHCESLRAAVPVIVDPALLDTDKILNLAIVLRETLADWRGTDRHIRMLSGKIGE